LGEAASAVLDLRYLLLFSRSSDYQARCGLSVTMDDSQAIREATLMITSEAGSIPVAWWGVS